MPSTTTTPSTREARYSPLKAHGSASSSSPRKARLDSSPSPSKEGERPRKRRRGDDDEEKEREVKKEEYVKQEPEQAKVELKRDPAYFFEDDKEARMYLQVEDFLFKIHRKKLYNSKLFKERLKTFVGEGDSIGDPVLLNSTTADSFRLLLNVLYMTALPLPDAYEMEYTDDTACEAVSLWRTARIYGFADEESWAVRLVERVCNVPAFMDSCGSNTLREIVDCLAVSQSEALGMVERKWAERVRKQGTPSVPAIYAAERYGLQHLGGVAYYQHVLDMLDRQHGDEDVKGKGNNNIPPRIRPDPKLTPDQIQRVLSGYMSLVTFWERFRRTAIPLPQGADCTQHDACKMNWERRWGSAIGWKRILGIASADVLELIACLRDQLKGDEELKSGLETKCREAGLEALRVCLEEVREGLAGYFLGPIRTDI